MNLINSKNSTLFTKWVFNYTEPYEKKNKMSGRKWGAKKKIKAMGKQMKKRMAILNKIKVEELEEVQNEVMELADLEKQIKSIW